MHIQRRPGPGSSWNTAPADQLSATTEKAERDKGPYSSCDAEFAKAKGWCTRRKSSGLSKGHQVVRDAVDGDGIALIG